MPQEGHLGLIPYLRKDINWRFLAIYFIEVLHTVTAILRGLKDTDIHCRPLYFLVPSLEQASIVHFDMFS